MSSVAPLSSIEGGRDKPAWAPRFLPGKATLDYLQSLATLILFALGILYFAGIDKLRPFAQRHIAAV